MLRTHTSSLHHLRLKQGLVFRIWIVRHDFLERFRTPQTLPVKYIWRGNTKNYLWEMQEFGEAANVLWPPPCRESVYWLLLWPCVGSTVDITLACAFLRLPCEGTTLLPSRPGSNFTSMVSSIVPLLPRSHQLVRVRNLSVIVCVLVLLSVLQAV